jgi:radical SAM superfamily enzyme YgiQ (UPF0313 family)
MSRRIVLVDLPSRLVGDDRPSLGHASLLAALRTEPNLTAHSVVQVVSRPDIQVPAIVRRIVEMVRQASPQETDVAIGAYVWNDKAVTALIAELRWRGFHGRIVVGGPQITYAESGLEKMYPEADAFIRGHAELALRQFAVNSGRPKIGGVHYAGEPDLGEQATLAFAQAPSPWLGEIDADHQGGHVYWETQRGCSFSCSFCQHRQPDARTRIVKVEFNRVDREIDLFHRMGIGRISVLDPIFNHDQEHAIRILRRFEAHGFKGELSLQCRAEMITSAFLDAAQELNVCLEFGLQSIYRREYLAVGRPNNMRKVEVVLRDVGRRRIRHEVSLIYGLPEQTLVSFEASIRWCQDVGVPVIKAFPLLSIARNSAL